MKGISSEPSTNNVRRHLIWLDNNIKSNSNQKTLAKLTDIDPLICGFDHVDEGLDYIESYRKKGGKLAILIIISGALSETTIPKIHDYEWISSIYIYCRNPRRLDHLRFAKLRDILNDPDDLIEQLKLDAERTQVSMDYHFFNEQSKTNDDHPTRNLKEEQTRFVWFYKWYQFMIDLQISENDEEAKAEMVQFCRDKFVHKSSEHRFIEQFENESFELHGTAAIKWYTKSACMFRWINQALFQGEITQIYRFRYMIRLICHQLKELDGNYRSLSNESVLRLYRGTALKLSKITEMSNHLHDLICVNSFLSTSTDKSTAINFSRVRRDDDLEAVLFIIDVDLDHSQNIAMANIREISHFQEEEEVLISVGAIFSIQSVKYNADEDLHTVHLILGDSEQFMVNKYVEETYKNDAALSDRAILFGKLLFEMGEQTLAIEYLRKCLTNLSDDDNYKRPIYLNNIAVCYNALDNKEQALIFYNQALKIFEKNPGNRGERDYYQNELGACYHNIASYYFSLKDYSTAYPMAIDALSKRQNFPLGQASTLDLLGRIQMVNRDYHAAQDSFRQSLRLRLKYLGQTNPNHPDIGISHENMGQLCFRKRRYEESLEQFARAAEIYRYNFEKTHPRVVAVEDGIMKIQDLIKGN